MKSIKLFYSFIALVGFFTLTSCGDDDTSDGPSTPQPEVLSGSLGTMTLTNDRIWIIDGITYVEEGETLTIEPGTIIKAEDLTGADASALIISRGAKINANGSAAQPIIFTSVNDDIQIGETESSGITNDISGSGQWGGLILLGNAPISAGGSSAVAGASPLGSEARIEGVPAADYSIYGGNDSNDNSGTLNYVSIRYTGTTLSTDSEIQGLTLGGVGSGTSLRNIEIFASKDDGIEFFGGTVNVTNVLIAYQEDDGLDIDQNYSGTIDNALVLNYTIDLEGSETSDQGALEIDGPEQSGTNDQGRFTITNTTIVNKLEDADENNGFPGQLKSGAAGTISNTAFVGFSDDSRTLEINSISSVGTTFQNVEFSQSSYSDNDAADDVMETNVNYSVTTPTVGANLNSFNWTFAQSLGIVSLN